MLTAAEQRVLDSVSESRLVDQCASLVRTPTVSPHSGDRAPSGELAGQEAVEAALQSMGARTERVLCRDALFDRVGVLAPHGRQTTDRPNVVGTVTLGDGNGPSILLDAHMDTVAVDHYEGMPFGGEIADGFIHGRGSSDDKQGVTVMLEAVRALQQSGSPCSGRLICCSVVDEECDGAGRGTLACLDHVGRVDAVFVIDGSFGTICHGCTGVVTADVLVTGRAGHAALGQSVNAIEKAVALMPAFQAFRRLRGNRPGDLNLGVFQAGDHPANVPHRARLALNLKTYPEDMDAARHAYGQDSGRLVRELFERCLAETVGQDEYLRLVPPRVHWVKDVPAAHQTGPGAALCSVTAQACLDTAGERPAVALLGGWGDIAHAIRAGLPAVGLGAGWPGAAHSASEKVAIRHLVTTARTLALTLHRVLTRQTHLHA